MKRVAIITLAAFTLTGCGIYKKYDAPTTLPDGLCGAVEVADSSATEIPQWRRIFQDSALQALIEEGLANNVDLQSARLRVEQAEASLTASKLAFLPSFALAPQASVSSYDAGRAVQSYTLPLSASWQIDLFGGVLNNKRQSHAALGQMEAYQQAVRTRLIASIANTYYTLLMLDAQLEISTQTKQKWEEGVRTAKALKQAGMYTEAGVAQMEATYYMICTSLEDLAEQSNQVQNSLALLLGSTPRDFVRGDLDQSAIPELFAEGIPVERLAQRPDVKSAAYALESAFYGVAKARASFYPSLVLSGTGGWSNSAGQMILNPAKLIASAVGSLTQPLFTQGQNRAKLKISKSQLAEAELQFNQTLLSAGSEVNDALTKYRTAQRKSLLFDEQVTALERAEKSTRLLMQHGNTNYLEVLTAQQTLLSARLTRVANHFTEIQGMINLYQALGGGAE